jgi:hypothetical protein
MLEGSDVKACEKAWRNAAGDRRRLVAKFRVGLPPR